MRLGAILFCFLGISRQAIRLYKRARHDGTHPEMILKHCREGRTDIIRTFLEDTPEIRTDSPLAYQCFKLAVKHNHPTLVTLLMEHFGINELQLRWALTKSLKMRRLDMITTLAPPEHFHDYSNHQVLRFAHTSMLWKFLHAQLDEMGSLGMCAAGRFGALEFFQSKVEYLREKFQFTGSVIAHTANEGHLHILRWLIDNEGPLYARIMQTGLLREEYISTLVSLMSIIERDDLDFFKAFFAAGNPRFLWPNYVRALISSSTIQICLSCNANKIYEYVMSSLVTLQMAFPDEKHPSLQYLYANLASAVCQAELTRRPTVIKQILHSVLPGGISKQFFVLEALPDALGISILQSVSMALDSWNDNELMQLFIETGFGLIRTKLQVLHEVCRAIKEKNISRLFVFIDAHPELSDMHDVIWDRLFFETDGFQAFISRCNCT